MFDSNTYAVYIVDQNVFFLMMGGSMEFLFIPIRKLLKGVQPLVNYLRFDRDKFMKQTTTVKVEKAATKNRKVGNTKSNKNVKLF